MLTVNVNQETLSGNDSQRTVPNSRSFTDGVFSSTRLLISEEDRSANSEEAAIDPRLFEQSTGEAVTAVQEAMKRHLPKDLFKALHEATDDPHYRSDSVSSSYLLSSDPQGVVTSKKLSISFSNLSFVSGIEEPLYLSATVYDTSGMRRLSETFYFELNEERFLGLFKKSLSAFATARQCVMSLGSHSRESTFLVIRIDKLIGSDADKDLGRFQKRLVSSLRLHCIVL